MLSSNQYQLFFHSALNLLNSEEIFITKINPWLVSVMSAICECQQKYCEPSSDEYAIIFQPYEWIVTEK